MNEFSLSGLFSLMNAGKYGMIVCWPCQETLKGSVISSHNHPHPPPPHFFFLSNKTFIEQRLLRAKKGTKWPK